MARPGPGSRRQTRMAHRRRRIVSYRIETSACTRVDRRVVDGRVFAKLACQPSYARREKRLHGNIAHSGQVRVKLKPVSQPRPKRPGWWVADRTPSAYSHVASAFASGVDPPRVSLLSLSLSHPPAPSVCESTSMCVAKTSFFGPALAWGHVLYARRMVSTARSMYGHPFKPAVRTFFSGVLKAKRETSTCEGHTEYVSARAIQQRQLRHQPRGEDLQCAHTNRWVDLCILKIRIRIRKHRFIT